MVSCMEQCTSGTDKGNHPNDKIYRSLYSAQWGQMGAKTCAQLPLFPE